MNLARDGHWVDAFRRLGIVAGGVLATVTLLGLIWGAAVTLTIRPMMEKIARDNASAIVESERRGAARDSVLGERLVDLSRDRVLILAVMEARDARQRTLALEAMRREWSQPRRDGQSYPYYK